ncbi:MAG TPA: DUF5808 domain-containing protein [Candidatus Dormibacteraeota bacterium]|nr:DUF5808 domain-containing protein [Candidatus Dormibacteraeota bacterium]
MRSLKRWRRMMRLIAVGLVVAAVAQELTKPPAQRTWRGRVLGVIPYDLTLPTWDRVQQAYWNPNDPRLFTERVVGVGWAINLYRARVLLSRLFSRMAGEGAKAQPIQLRRSR